MAKQKYVGDEASRHFAQLFGDALYAAGMSGEAHIGQQLAMVQEYPDRDGIPYNKGVVGSWLQGTAVPSLNTFHAICDMLSDHLPRGFEEAYEEALMGAEYSPTEVSMTLLQRVLDHGLSYHRVADALFDHGITGSKGEKLSTPSICYMCHGQLKIPPATAEILDQLLPPAPGEPPLTQLLALDRKVSREEWLERAAQTDSIHEVFLFIRRALGFTGVQMARAIDQEVEGHHTSSASVQQWEGTMKDPHKHSLPTRHSFPRTDPLTVYGTILSKHGMGEWWIAHESEFRGMLKRAIALRENFMGDRFDYTPSVPRTNSAPSVSDWAAQPPRVGTHAGELQARLVAQANRDL